MTENRHTKPWTKRAILLVAICTLTLTSIGCGSAWQALTLDALVSPRMSKALLLALDCYSTGECELDMSTAVGSKDSFEFVPDYMLGPKVVDPKCVAAAQAAAGRENAQIFYQETPHGVCIIGSDEIPRSWKFAAGETVAYYRQHRAQIANAARGIDDDWQGPTERLSPSSAPSAPSTRRLVPEPQPVERKLLYRIETFNGER